MTKIEIAELQKKMAEKGFYKGKIDGLWGPMSEAAYKLFKANLEQSCNLDIAWSAKVSTEFVERVKEISNNLKMTANGPDYLMACMAWETGETFSPAIVNGAGSKAQGLIQFMPTTAKSLGTSTEALARMTAVEQLDYVEKYFKPYKGRIETLSDTYSVILWPKAVGKPESYVLFDKDVSPIAYRQNSGIDVNKDGKCTKQEAAAKVMEKLNKGLQPSCRRPLN